MKWIIWGAGKWGREFLHNIRMSGLDIRIIAFADNDSSIWHTKVGGIEVIPPDEIKSYDFDYIIICIQAHADEIRTQIVEELQIPGEHIIRNKTDPSPIRFDAKSDEVYLAQLGEFGYEMISWLPYLTYLKSQGLKLKTIGRPGSTVFYELISDEHIEVGNEYIGNMFGERKLIDKLKNVTGLPVFSPCNEHMNFGFFVDGIEWDVKDIHSPYPVRHLRKPMFNEQNIIGIKEKKKKYRGLVTINNKNYYNWKYTLVKNFFTGEELDILVKFLTEKGFLVVYNNPASLFFENTNIYDDPPRISYKSEMLIDLGRYKIDSIDQWDAVQLECWQNSDFVIQTPSGAAAVPELLGIRKYYLMRRGDYQDNVFLENLYGGKQDTFYEIKHMITYMEKELG